MTDRTHTCLTDALRARLGTVVGFVSVTRPQEYTRTYEMPAWWTELRSDVGTYPIVLSCGDYNSFRPVLRATLLATVVSSYTQAHFGGVPFGNAPQCKQHRDVGRRDAFVVECDLVAAATESGRSIDHEVRFVLDEDVELLVVPFALADLAEKRQHAAGVDAALDAVLRGEKPSDWLHQNRDLYSLLGSVKIHHQWVAEAAGWLETLHAPFHGCRKSYPQNYSREAADAYIAGKRQA